MFAASCGSFRGMRLAGAFFANHAEVVDDMLNVEGGFWASTTAPREIPVRCHRPVMSEREVHVAGKGSSPTPHPLGFAKANRS